MLFDFELVSSIVKSQYKIYRTLGQEQDRHFAVYFKIGFFGLQWPAMFKNREFIYRGQKLMRRIDVVQKIQKYFTDASLIETSGQSEQVASKNPVRFIKIDKVDVLTYLELKDFDMAATTKDKEELEIGKKAKDLPSRLRTYYLENFKNKFYKQSMIDKGTGEELQNDRQIEIFKVKNKFPTIFTLQEIIKVKKIIRLAIDEAIRNVQTIIDTIEGLKNTATTTQDPTDFDFLTQQIKASLESPIQGGMKRYIVTFITKPNLQKDKVKTLQLLSKIMQCLAVINDGIQAIQSFTQEETMLTIIQQDYQNFKEWLNQHVEAANRS